MPLPPAPPAVRSPPADLLTLGLGAGGDGIDLEAEIELGEFLCACPELELHSCLGRGGMGIVYRARQVRLDRDVAVKLMSPAASDDPEFARRFEREAKAMARLDHPGIVRVHDFGQAAGVYYLVMELVDGPNLRELIEPGLSDAQASQIIGQLCDALAYAHEQGVVHRDIKPENVLIDRRGRVRVADFGLAKLQTEPAGGATRTRRVLGTPQYMAPEQLRDPGSVDERCDIFAIGVVFYEMLTGQLPVGRFPAPSELGRGDAQLDEIVLRALESNRERRYQAARELQTALTERTEATTATEPESSPRRRRWLVAAGGIAAAALATVWISASHGSSGEGRGPDPSVDVSAADAEATTAAPAVSSAPDAAKQLNRWPARELTVLDPDVVGVVGIDWSELRQSPLVTRLSDVVLAQRPVALARCKQDIIDRTHKIVVAFTSTGVRELVIHGDWEPSQLQPCLDELAAIPRRNGEPRPQLREIAFGPHRRFIVPRWGEHPARAEAGTHSDSGSDSGEGEGDSGGERALPREDQTRGERGQFEVTVGHDGHTVVISLREDITVEQLDAKLAGESESTQFRDTVIRLVDLAAPIWVAAEPSAGELPLSMRSIGGEVELWDKIGLDVSATFEDQAAAAKATTLAQSYINIMTAVPDFPSPPQLSVTQEGASVRVSGTFEPPTLDLHRGPGLGHGPGHALRFDFGTPSPEVQAALETKVEREGGAVIEIGTHLP